MVLFSGGMAVARLITPPSPNESATQVAAFYLHHANDILTGSILAGFRGRLLVPWNSAIASRFRRIQGPSSPAGYCQQAFGLLLAIEVAFPLVLANFDVSEGQGPPRD